ncbi:hypothetical protein KR074_009561 [Drosophila pseudoananassae]|nr:hypothetical protein KR074_009561 [Drosophila pseudoananassae]
MPRQLCWAILGGVVLAATLLHLCEGNYYRDRRRHCLDLHANGQSNCSKCAELYVFMKSHGTRRCEHVNGRCFPYRTVFPNAQTCERICQPWIVHATLHLVTTPKPVVIVPADYSGDSSADVEEKQ